MKKLCFFVLILMMTSGSTFANGKDPELISDTLTADRVIVLKLNNWKAETIQVIIRKQDGSLVLAESLDGIHTDTKRYILNDLKEGNYQLELKGKSKCYSQQFSVTNEKLLLSKEGFTEPFNPVLKQSRKYPDISTQVKEKWYQLYHTTSGKD